MTRTHSRRQPAGAHGAKLLITTSALAATLGGWATLARQQPEPVAELPAQAAAPAAPAVAAPLVRFAPIPTIVPLVNARDVAVARPPSISVPAQPAAAQPASAAPDARPVQAAQPVAAPPPAAPPALRAVNAPAAPAQQPVARTRSSR